MHTFDTSILTYDQFRVLMAAIEVSQALDKAERERLLGAGHSDFCSQIRVMQQWNVESTAHQLFNLGFKEPMAFGQVQRLVKKEIEARRKALAETRTELERYRLEQQQLEEVKG